MGRMYKRPISGYELPKDLRELFTKCKAECAARAVMASSQGM